MIATLAALLLAAGGQPVDRDLRPIWLYDSASTLWHPYRERCPTAEQRRRGDALNVRLKNAEDILVSRYGQSVVDEQEFAPLGPVRRLQPCDRALEAANLDQLDILLRELETELRKQ